MVLKGQGVHHGMHGAWRESTENIPELPAVRTGCWKVNGSKDVDGRQAATAFHRKWRAGFLPAPWLIPDSHSLVERDTRSPPTEGRVSLVGGNMYLSPGLCKISKINWVRVIQLNRNIPVFVTKWCSRRRRKMREQHFMSPDLLIILKCLAYS